MIQMNTYVPIIALFVCSFDCCSSVRLGSVASSSTMAGALCNSTQVGIRLCLHLFLRGAEELINEPLLYCDDGYNQNLS